MAKNRHSILSFTRHGWHVHALGKCDPPDFTSAGAHFNPNNKKHGLQSPDGPHAGDSEGLEVKADGTAEFEYVNKLLKFATGANSLFQKDGLAIIIYAQEDDQKTDPTECRCRTQVQEASVLEAHRHNVAN